MSATPRPDDRVRFVGQLWLLVAALRLVSAWIRSDPEGPRRGDQLFASTFLLAVHSVFYFYGGRFRASKKGSAVGYFGIQATLAAAIGLYSQSALLTVALFGALMGEGLLLLRRRVK